MKTPDENGAKEQSKTSKLWKKINIKGLIIYLPTGMYYCYFKANKKIAKKPLDIKRGKAEIKLIEEKKLAGTTFSAPCPVSLFHVSLRHVALFAAIRKRPLSPSSCFMTCIQGDMS